MNNIFDKQYLEQLSSEILSEVKKRGATSAEVNISIEAGFSVSARLGQTETVEHHQDKGVGLTVYFDHKTGSASSSDLSPEAIEAIIIKACDIANYTNSDPYAGLADKALMAFDYPNVDLDHPWNINTEQALELAIECENVGRDDKRITNSEGASLSSHRTLHMYANSHDFVGSYYTTQHNLNCVLIAQESDQMHRDFEYSSARSAADLESVQSVGKKAQQRTINRLGARRIKTCDAPVIFSAEIARSLLGNFVSAIAGGNLYRNSSFLVNSLNEQIFPNFIDIEQMPHIPKALASSPFDNDGVRTLRQYYVKEGILEKYVLGSYSARKLGMQTTGNAGGVFNLVIKTSNQSLKDLIKAMGRGLIVTELIGQGVNIVTGDYSRGAFGFWVENGEIQFPVQEVTIAGNLKDIFMNIISIANDVDHRSRILTGSILVDHMTIAGE